jgi:succinyl-CoA synthetase alpha subunit
MPMTRAFRIVRNLYRDSVSMMQLSAALSALPGIEQASAVMASPANLELLREAALLEGGVDAGPNDLVVAVRGRDEAAVATALQQAEKALAEAPAARAAGPTAMAPRSLAMALAADPGANLALVSTPGAYAAAEAEKALRAGLNVMLFSDNVPVAEEVALKRLAETRGLLVMGPDCGTAIIDGVPLGFANVVRRGSIGCVAASGTGLQQVTCLVSRRRSAPAGAISTPRSAAARCCTASRCSPLIPRRK